MKPTLKILSIAGVSIVLVLLITLGVLTPLQSQPIIGDPATAKDDKIWGSKHDFTGLNRRAGVTAMSGLAFSDYGNPCVYCHVPPEKVGQNPTQFGGIEGWNRMTPATGSYDLYDSTYLDSKTRTPSPISLLCLSCHDGTMAVDMVVFKPDTFDTADDAALHMRINGASSLSTCGRCHNGTIAHDIAIKHLGTDLRNDHPISMIYAGLGGIDPDFKEPDRMNAFSNGVKLFENRVECATCHNVHNPENEPFLRVRSDLLCQTCHLK